MAKMTAVILAAGMGVRMGPRGKMTPKGLIELGGISLVARSIDTLRNWGADRIVIVTGHLADHYEAAFGASDVELIYNPDYTTTGSLLSLSVALQYVDGPLVIVESDVIYAPQALDVVDCSVNQFVVSGPTHAGDEVYIWASETEDGTPYMSGVSKDRAYRAETPFGEMVGITGLTKKSAQAMRALTKELVQTTDIEHYEPGLLELSKEVPIECVFVDDVPWAEIDDEEMLARAERMILPRVVAATKAR